MWPQSRVTEPSLVSKLEYKVTQWQQNDYMKYADVVYNGQKYRGIRLTTEHGDSKENGYELNKSYWFNGNR